MLVLVLLSILIGIYTYLLCLRKSQDTDNEPPVAPQGWPIAGHAPYMLRNSCYLWSKLTELADKINDMGGVVTVLIGPQPAYDPDDFLTVSNTCFQKNEFYEFSKPWLGQGLVTADEPIWKKHRKLLNPAFSQVILDGFIDVFNMQARRLVEDLEKEAGKGPFDHWKYTRHNGLETICLTALGVDYNDNTLLNSQYVTAVEEMFVTLVNRVQKFWLHSPHIFRWSSVKRKQDACLKILHNMSNTVLQKKKLEWKYNIPTKNKVCKPGIKAEKLKVFMDLILELAVEKGVFNDKEIRDHVDTMIVSGHDTSANVLMYTLMLLGSHPKVQERVFEELDNFFGDSDRDVEKLDLSQLVYVEAVLKESMRIYTIVPVIARRLDRDVKLKNYTLAAGRSCFMLISGVHRHPMWGPDVLEFKPERWLSPASLPSNPHAFAAFSMGKRMCIGKTYALMSMKITLAHVMRHYRIQADHTKLELQIDIMLKPKSGYSISIEKRMGEKGNY